MAEPKHRLEPYNSQAIIKNVELVFRTGEINKLSKASYNFIYLMSGFIAHYDLYGFQNYYQDLRLFAQDLLNSTDMAEPDREVQDHYFTDNYGIEYCQSKVDTLKGIKAVVEKYNNAIYDQEEAKDKNKLALLEVTINKVKGNPEATQNLLAQLGL